MNIDFVGNYIEKTVLDRIKGISRTEICNSKQRFILEWKLVAYNDVIGIIHDAYRKLDEIKKKGSGK